MLHIVFDNYGDINNFDAKVIKQLSEQLTVICNDLTNKTNDVISHQVSRATVKPRLNYPFPINLLLPSKIVWCKPG